jgi:hypothetical protein
VIGTPQTSPTVMRMPKDFRHCYCICLLTALAGLAPRSARADVTGAARAFAEGQAAQLEGKPALAAERFELAFALQPSKEALRSAARMQLSAENFARAATHAQTLLDRFGEDAQSVELARSILENLAPRLARYEVSCAPACALLVDNLAYFLEPASQHRLYLTPGRVLLEAHFASGRKASRAVSTSSGATTRIKLEEPDVAEPSRTVPGASSSERPRREAERASARVSVSAGEPSKGVPVAVPWITGAATVVCGALTLWAGVDTRRLHAEYVEHPTDEKWNDGIARQNLTNALLASTAALGVATVTLTFFVRGSAKTSAFVSPVLGPSSASLALTGRF